jgi:hypothetical protein
MGSNGIAYGLIGPRVSKLVFEASLLKLCYGTKEIKLYLFVFPVILNYDISS